MAAVLGTVFDTSKKIVLFGFQVHVSLFQISKIAFCTAHGDGLEWLNHCGRVTLKYVGTLTIIGSNNGFVGAKPFIGTDAGIWLIESLGTHFNEILIETHTFS